MLISCKSPFTDRISAIRTAITFIVLFTVIMTGSIVNAELLVNGDFEDTTGWGDWGDPISEAPFGWRETPSSTYDQL